MAISIHCETAAKLNFACHQNAFAFLQYLRVDSNDHETRLDDVFVSLSSNPAFLKPKSWRLDRIAPEGSILIEDRDIELDGDFLLNLTDAVRGTVTITVEKPGLVLAEETKPVELLAYNEWGGAGYMPELLAAFSVPNDPAVDRVLRDASLILRKAGNLMASMAIRRGVASAYGKSRRPSILPSATSASPIPCPRRVSSVTGKKSDCLAKSWRTA